MILALFFACTPDKPDPGDTADDTGVADADGDGYDAPADCDDTDPDVFPDAEDAPYDGVDADCAGNSDYDVDGDGYDAGRDGGDCNDADPDIGPDADETCNGLDDDCDGHVDEGAVDEETWYEDADGDGFGNGHRSSRACAAPDDGWVRNGDDCDDLDADVSPAATEVRCSGADDDCDGDYGDSGAVGADGTVYATLTAAIQHASAGDTLSVCEGTLTERVVVDRPVTIEGYPDAIVEGASSGSVFVITADTTIRRLTIRIGVGESDGTYTTGGLLLVDGGTTVHVEDSELANGDADIGGCIRMGFDANVTLSNVEVRSCDAQVGAGVDMDAGARLTLEDSSIHDNSSELTGGGITMAGNSRLTLEGSTIEGNDAQVAAGVDVTDGGTVTLDGSSAVTDNSASSGGGVFLGDGATWTGGSVTGNDADELGGGVYVQDDDATVTMSGVEISDNSGGYGGGVYTAGTLTLSNCTLNGNDALTGGGVYAGLGGSAHVDGGSVTRNTALLGGGGAAIWSDGFVASEGANWGSGGSNNSPEDVYIWTGSAERTYSYGSDATFNCSAWGCD
jgi:hypothetical protein